MKLSDFDYRLPPERIAQHPAERRDRSRLMVLEGDGSPPAHFLFRRLPELLQPGDLLVLNDSRVIRARLLGRKPSGARVELLLDRLPGRPWREDGHFCQLLTCLAGGGRLKPGAQIELPGNARAFFRSRRDELTEVLLRTPLPALEYLERHGRVPLPPYIRREPEAVDAVRYQTVYARRPGSVAAPTAGLHFTPGLLGRIEERGVRLARITLHVGSGTFLPVRRDDVESHRMHAERYEISPATAAAIARTKESGGRVVAVGTTVVRTLEAAWRPGGIRAGEGETDLFIRPGFDFRVVDRLVTNFHLPRSTLLMLVCAFAGTERILGAYREAVRQGYRFYSYGDAMLLGRAR